MLNRDIANNEIDIYDISSSQSLSGELDTRLVSEEGWQSIRDDMKVTKVGFYDVANDILTAESLTFLDSFEHQGNKVAMYDGVQNAIKNSTALQEKLSDPNLTKEEKNQVLREIAVSVAKELNIKLSDVSTIASNSTTEEGEKIKGAYHEASGDIAVNDVENTSTGDTLNTLGNELSHLLDTQRGESREGVTSSGETFKDEYSNLMGDSMEDYANFAMYNYTDSTLASTNSHNGIEVPTSVFDPNYDTATQNFENRNANGELEYRVELIGRDLSIPIPFVDPDAKHAFNVISGDSSSYFTQEEKDKFGEPIDLGNGRVGYVTESLNIDGKLVPVINGKMKNSDGKWVEADGGLTSLNEYKEQQKKQDKDDMHIIRTEPDNKEAEGKIFNNINLTNISNSPNYPSSKDTFKEGLKENRASSESLPNSNADARKNYESGGYSPITFDELENERKYGEGAYYPGILPKDRITNEN